jgi:hypothetical protein
MEWSDVHEYRRLAELGLAKHLTCPNDDDGQLVSRMGDNDDPVYWCPVCDTVLTPGLDMIGQIRAVVSEFNV